MVYFVPLFFQVKKIHGCVSFQTLPFPASPGEEFPLGRRPIIALDRGLTHGLWDFHQLQLRAIHQRVAHRPKRGGHWVEPKMYQKWSVLNTGLEDGSFMKLRGHDAAVTWLFFGGGEGNSCDTHCVCMSFV